MNQSPWIWWVAIAILLSFFLFKRTSPAQTAEVDAALRENALVIDVRTAGEFASGHLPGVTNIPLDRIKKEIPELAPDRDKPILLHCLSGARSASACSELKQMGYTRVYNLGSYARAEKLIRANRSN